MQTGELWYCSHITGIYYFFCISKETGLVWASTQYGSINLRIFSADQLLSEGWRLL